MTRSFWKSWAVYLVIVAPFMVLGVLFVHDRWLRAAATAVIMFTGLCVRDRVQRRTRP